MRILLTTLTATLLCLLPVTFASSPTGDFTEPSPLTCNNTSSPEVHDCMVEFKHWGGDGLCAHGGGDSYEGSDGCVYTHDDGQLCLYVNGDVCTPVEV